MVRVIFDEELKRESPPEIEQLERVTRRLTNGKVVRDGSLNAEQKINLLTKAINYRDSYPQYRLHAAQIALNEAGRFWEKAARKLSGPTPKPAVRRVLKPSTAMAQLVE